MKKLSIPLLLVMLLSLAACGGSPTEVSQSADVSESISQPADNAAEAEAAEEPASVQEAEPAAPADFEEITVVDNDQCVIKITGIDPDNMWGYTIKAYLENKSADRNYMFSVAAAAINGIQTDPLFASSVAPGKKSNEEISFLDSTLEENGITEYTDIMLTFRVHDDDDWEADAIANETVHIYPLGEENAAPFVREAQPTDTVLVDNDNISVIVTGYDPDGLWGYTVNLYLVNKTDKNLMFCADDVSVNGYMADPFWATSVGAGLSAFSDTFSWADSTLEENGIETVEEIAMQLRVYDEDDWMADDVYSETVTLAP